MGRPEPAGMARGHPHQGNQVWAQEGPYTSPASRPAADSPFTATSPSQYEDQWARDEGPTQGNWAGKFESDEGSEEEDDALSYYLSPVGR